MPPPIYSIPTPTTRGNISPEQASETTAEVYTTPTTEVEHQVKTKTKDAEENEPKRKLVTTALLRNYTRTKQKGEQETKT